MEKAVVVLAELVSCVGLVQERDKLFLGEAAAVERVDLSDHPACLALLHGEARVVQGCREQVHHVLGVKVPFPVLVELAEGGVDAHVKAAEFAELVPIEESGCELAKVDAAVVPQVDPLQELDDFVVSELVPLFPELHLLGQRNQGRAEPSAKPRVAKFDFSSSEV